MYLIFLAIGWLVGLWLGQMAAGGLLQGEAANAEVLRQAELWLALLALVAGLAALLAGSDRRLRITALAVGLGLLGVWRVFGLVPDLRASPVPTGTVVVHGAISDRPEPRDATMLLVLDVDRVQREGRWEPARMRVLARTDRFAEWAYGDRVVAAGELRPVGTDARYWAEHLARRGIYVTMEYPRMRLEGRPDGPDPRRWIDAVRGRLDEICASLLPEPQASLLAGILVGARDSMPADFRDALNATSTSHIVAVSGFNVTVVAGLAQLAALRFLARREATLLALLAVWLYALLTGLPPSAFRAATMASMVLGAILAGRGGDSLGFLCLSGALIAGLDPLMLSDLGFQLSFLATAGLVLLEPVLRRWLGMLPGWLATSLSVTLAAQLATLPILVVNFHYLSLVSPLSNLLIAPMLPGVMVVGWLAVALAALAEPLGQPVAPVAWLYLTYLVEVIRWTARIPGAAVATGGLETGVVAVYYLLLLTVALWPLPEMRRVRDVALSLRSRVPGWLAVGATAGALALLVLVSSDRPDGKVHVYFLNVGHGDATLIRGPSGHRILVDGGPSPTAIEGALGSRLGFLDRSLDAVVLTGYGEDRLAGLLEVARRHPIGLVLQPDLPYEGRAARAWRETISERGLATVRAAARQRIDLGDDVYLEVAWAADGDSQERELAARLVAFGVVVLLPGDLSRASQSEMARALPGRVEVLRVPRHGAAGALEERLLQGISSRVAVVSVGAGNRLDHPAASTLAMLGESLVLRTDRHGTIELSIGRDGYELHVDR